MPWHTLPAGVVAGQLGVDVAAGLGRGEVLRRLERDGRNVLAETRRDGPWRMLARQFTDFMVLVLLAAAVIAGFLGEPQDIVAIVVIVILNAALGFGQEYRADRAMEALRALAAPEVRVKRGGTIVTVPAADIVAGDVVILEAGNLVPADLRIVEAARLRIDEATLTGESQPVDKAPDVLDIADLALGDRRNMAYRGTSVTLGRGAGIVIATGMRTELGRIADLVRGQQEGRTPLQKRLLALGKRLSIVVLLLCAFIFVAGLLRGEEPGLMFLTALSIAVAGVPEALPAVVTLSLALGARKMARNHALVRRLPAVETLGSVTYICSDKTGTLTQNHMKVEACYVDGERGGQLAYSALDRQPWPRLLEALALSNDAAVGPAGIVTGDPTEVALLESAIRAGAEKAALERSLPRVAELPFSSERACMTTLHRRDAGIVAFTKGAPEQVLARCDAREGADGPVPLDRGAVLAEAEAMARDGLRVLAFAWREWPAVPGLTPDTVERGLRFLGLVGLIDPPRREARDAVALCQSAGIRVVMITGDHPATAGAIARDLGIAATGDEVMTGRELAAADAGMLQRRAGSIRVFARVAPEQKIAIVEALQARGEFVAMTGDGVNDAPALRRADIGIAMGRSGTDVAREAAHLVLVDDNFATIVGAVREGRRIYDNLRKFVRYQLATGVGEMLPLLVAPFLGLPVPLLPIHILWINLVTDGLPGLSLAAEPAEGDVMRRPPRPPSESIFAHGLWQHVVWVGFLMGGLIIGMQAWSWHTGTSHWQSMTFTLMALAQMAHVLAIRTERESLFRVGLWSNRPLLGAVVLTFVLQLATLYVPALNRVFKTQPLSAGELLLTLGLASLIFVAVEIEKAIRRRAPGPGAEPVPA